MSNQKRFALIGSNIGPIDKSDALADGDILVYNATTGKWVTQQLTAIGSLAETIQDTVDAMIADGAGLVWTYDDGGATLTPEWDATSVTIDTDLLIVTDAGGTEALRVTDAGMLQITGGVGGSDFALAPGLEMGYSTTQGAGFFQAYNRATSTYLPLSFTGSSTNFYNNAGGLSLTFAHYGYPSITSVGHLGLFPNPGSQAIVFANGANAQLHVYDGGGSDSIYFYNDGTSGWIAGQNAASISFAGLPIRVYDAGLTDYGQFSHNSTNFLAAFTNTATVAFSGASTSYSFDAPVHMLSAASGLAGFAAVLSSDVPGILWRDTGEGATGQYWRDFVAGNVRQFDAHDGTSTANAWLRVLRTGATVDEVEVNGALLDFNGPADFSDNITLSSADFLLNKSAADGALYISSGTTIGADGAALLLFGTSHAILPGQMYLDAGAHIFRSVDAGTTLAVFTAAEIDLTAALLDFNGLIDNDQGVALGGGAAATLGTIGGSGPATAGQAQWLKIKISGTDHWIPAWT